MYNCTALVTGFDWYRGIDGKIFHPNPSGAVASSLDNVVLDKCLIKSIVLEVDFKSLDLLENTLYFLKPEVVVSLGLYPNTTEPLIELTGVNYGFCRSVDCLYNDYLYGDSPLVAHIQIDFKKLIEYLKSRGYSIKLSNTSGLYLCNAVAYTIYSYSAKYSKPAVFLHIPPVAELRLRLDLPINTSWSMFLLRELVIDIIKYFIREKQATCI